MPTVAVPLNLFKNFLADAYRGLHDFSDNDLAVALTNTEPDQAADSVIGDITEIDYMYLSSRDINLLSEGLSTSSYRVTSAPLTIHCYGGVSAAFQYSVIYKKSNGRLIGYSDYGATLMLGDGDSLKIQNSTYLLEHK